MFLLLSTIDAINPAIGICEPAEVEVWHTDAIMPAQAAAKVAVSTSF